MNQNLSPEQIASVVDELGAIRAQIAELRTAEAQAEAILIANGTGQKPGTFFDACVVSAGARETVAWKAIAEKVGFSPQLKTAHTTISAVKASVRITARLTTK